MGFRFRKSIKLGKNVRLNLNKKSVGLSVGGKAGRVTVNSKGRVTTTARVPGTGVSYTKTGHIGANSAQRSTYPKASIDTKLATAMSEHPEFFDNNKTDEMIRKRYSAGTLKFMRGILYFLSFLCFLLTILCILYLIFEIEISMIVISVISLIVGVVSAAMAKRYGRIIKHKMKK